QFQPNVESSGSAHLHEDVSSSRLVETCFLSCDFVAAGSQREEGVDTFSIGLLSNTLAGGWVSQSDFGIGNGGFRGVNHLTGDDSSVLRVEPRVRYQQQKHKSDKVP